MIKDIVYKASEAASYIASKSNSKPKIAIIVGYGLDAYIDEENGEMGEVFIEEITEGRVEIRYDEIPHFPKTRKDSYSDKLVMGKIYDKDVIVIQNKFHYYDGYNLDEVTFPIRILALLGIETLIISASAGFVKKDLRKHDIMLIKDHINVQGISPLRGFNESEFGSCFPNMMNIYSERLIKLAYDVASLKAFDEEFDRKAMKKIKNGYDLTIDLKEGIYAYMTGPQYETMAEVRMLEVIGADAVGMSLVPEVIVASSMGIEILGIACIKNAAGMGDPFGQEDYKLEKFKNLVMRIIMKM